MKEYILKLTDTQLTLIGKALHQSRLPHVEVVYLMNEISVQIEKQKEEIKKEEQQSA